MSKSVSLVILFLMGIGPMVKTSFLGNRDPPIKDVYVYTNQAMKKNCKDIEFSPNSPLFIEFVGVKITENLKVKMKITDFRKDEPKVEYDDEFLHVKVDREVGYDSEGGEALYEHSFAVTLFRNNSPDAVYRFKVIGGTLNFYFANSGKCELEINGEEMSYDVHTDTNWGYSLQKQFSNKPRRIGDGVGGPLYLVEYGEDKRMVLKVRYGTFYNDTKNEDRFIDILRHNPGVIQKAEPSIDTENIKTITLRLEYYNDGDLFEYAKKHFFEEKTENKEDALNTFWGLMYNVLNTIRDMQNEKIIHQDIRLENILLRGGKAFVADLQDARYFREGEDWCGELMYAPPGYISKFFKVKTNSAYIAEEKDYHALYVMIFRVLSARELFWNKEITKENKFTMLQKLYNHINSNQEEYEKMLGRIFHPMLNYFKWKNEEIKIYKKGINGSITLQDIKKNSTEQIKKIAQAFDEEFDVQLSVYTKNKGEDISHENPLVLQLKRFNNTAAKLEVQVTIDSVNLQNEEEIQLKSKSNFLTVSKNDNNKNSFDVTLFPKKNSQDGREDDHAVYRFELDYPKKTKCALIDEDAEGSYVVRAKTKWGFSFEESFIIKRFPEYYDATSISKLTADANSGTLAWTSTES